MAIEQTELVGKRIKLIIDGKTVKHLEVALTTAEQIKISETVEFTLIERIGAGYSKNVYSFICQLDDNRKFYLHEESVIWCIDKSLMIIIDQQPKDDHEGMIYNKYNDSWSFI